MRLSKGSLSSMLLIAACCAGCGTPVPDVKSTEVVEQSTGTDLEIHPTKEEATEAELAEPIQLSPAAAAHVRELLAKDSTNDKLRISLVERFGGDVHWNASLTSKVNALDDTTYTSQGITIVVDLATQKLIVGTKVDCVDRNGVKAFVFDNPRLKTLR